jgi:hypothetical protein
LEPKEIDSATEIIRRTSGVGELKMSETRKYLQKQSITDGPVTVSDSDAVANHERFFKDRLEYSNRPQMESELRTLPADSLKRLAYRQRMRLAGEHTPAEVNSTSREVTIDHVSRVAAARLFVAGLFPQVNRNSAQFSEAVAYALMNEDEQADYERRHPEKFI